MTAKNSSSSPAVKSQVASVSLRKASRELRRFYKAGKKSVDDVPGRLSHEILITHASKLGLSAEMMRRARVLASVYDQHELDSLIAQAEQSGYVLGISVITRLTSVPRRWRPKLERLVVESKLSKRQLDAEIRKRFRIKNAKPTAGPHYKAVKRAEDAEYLLARLCYQWGRLLKTLQQPAKRGDGRQPQPVWPSLSSKLQERIARVNKPLTKLRDLVDPPRTNRHHTVQRRQQQ